MNPIKMAPRSLLGQLPQKSDLFHNVPSSYHLRLSDATTANILLALFFSPTRMLEKVHAINEIVPEHLLSSSSLFGHHILLKKQQWHFGVQVNNREITDKLFSEFRHELVESNKARNLKMISSGISEPILAKLQIHKQKTITKTQIQKAHFCKVT
jgi:hypothetical protein